MTEINKELEALEELRLLTSGFDVDAMTEQFTIMIKKWAEMANFKLNKTKHSNFVELFSDFTYIKNHLEPINEFQEFIDFCIMVKRIIDYV